VLFVNQDNIEWDQIVYSVQKDITHKEEKKPLVLHVEPLKKLSNDLFSIASTLGIMVSQPPVIINVLQMDG